MTTGERWRLGRLPALDLRDACLWGPLALALVVLTAFWSTYDRSDWPLVRPAARLLLHGDLHLYVEHPMAQMGPLALFLIGVVPTPLYGVLVCCLLPIVVWLATAGVSMTRRRWVCLLAGAILLVYPWTQLAATGHADDALVIVGALAMVAGLREQRDWMVCAGFLVGIAAKPTAVVFLPLLLLAGRRRTPVAALVGMGLIWAPFALADLHGFLAAGHGVTLVWEGSLPNLLGAPINGSYPAWVRPLQLLGGLALCWVVARRVSPASALVAVIAFRAMLEPGAFSSYSTGVIALALVADLELFEAPVLGVLAALSFGCAMSLPMSIPMGALRLVALLAAILAVSLRPTGIRRHAGSIPAPTVLAATPVALTR